MTELIKFEKNNIPAPFESRETNDNKYVWYGTNNLYPEYLVSLYTDSPIHSSIINSKAVYITGDGLKYEDGKDVDFTVNASDNIKEFTDKIIKDFLIYNAFAVEVLFNAFNEPIEYHHVSMFKLRINKSKTKFWYNDSWSLGGKNIIYDRWTKNNQDTKSKIFYFDGYFPSLNNVYTTPEYSGAIKSITTDIAIREFNLNNVKNSFSASSIITFFNGTNVADDVKKKVISDLKASYQGESGKKIIIDFANPNGKSAEVQQLSPNDWSEAYEVLRQDTSDDIYKAHAVTSPSLMGVKESGQLGGSQELETAYEIFKNTYVRSKRDELESALNMLFSTNKEIKGKVAFQDKPLFQTRLSEQTKLQVMTINELREEAGLPKIADGDRMVGQAAPQVQPAEAPATETPSVEAEEVKKNSSRKLTEADYDQVHHLGMRLDEFEILGDHDDATELKFDAESDIAQYVISNDIKGLTLDQLNDLIKKDTGANVSANDLRDILGKINESGVADVEWKDGKVKVRPAKSADLPDTKKVSVMYQYVERPGVPNAAKSRDFCTKLMENNRLYTREDIQAMSSLFGYDVYQYAGGFYYNPVSDTTTPYCRHKWKALRVAKRNS